MFQSAESRKQRASESPKAKVIWSLLLLSLQLLSKQCWDLRWRETTTYLPPAILCEFKCKNLIIGRRTPCMLWRRVICCLQLLWSISLITMRYKSSKPLSLYKKNVFVQVLQWNRKRLVSSYLGPGQPKSPILNHFFNFNSNFSIHPNYPIIPPWFTLVQLQLPDVYYYWHEMGRYRK